MKRIYNEKSMNWDVVTHKQGQQIVQRDMHIIGYQNMLTQRCQQDEQEIQLLKQYDQQLERIEQYKQRFQQYLDLDPETKRTLLKNNWQFLNQNQWTLNQSQQAEQEIQRAEQEIRWIEQEFERTERIQQDVERNLWKVQGMTQQEQQTYEQWLQNNQCFLSCENERLAQIQWGLEHNQHLLRQWGAVISSLEQRNNGKKEMDSSYSNIKKNEKCGLGGKDNF